MKTIVFNFISSMWLHGLKVRRLRLSLFFLGVSAFLLMMSIACSKGGDDDIPEPATVAVSSIRLNRSSVTLSAGETAELVATVYPENATNKTVAWSSSNTGVATVSNGKVTAVAVGTATITAQAGTVKAECAVTVDRPIEVTSVELNKVSATLSPGGSIKLTATVYPENATHKTLTWSSSNTGVATVEDGKVTAITKGTAMITVKSNNGRSATCLIAVDKDDVPPGGSEGTEEEEW